MKEKKDVEYVVFRASVEGCINAEKASVLIENSGDFIGYLKGQTVDIGGTFKGTVEAQGKVLLRDQSHVDGKIIAETFEVHEGASGDFTLHVRNNSVLSTDTGGEQSSASKAEGTDNYYKEKWDGTHKNNTRTTEDDGKPVKAMNIERENYWS